MGPHEPTPTPRLEDVTYSIPPELCGALREAGEKMTAVMRAAAAALSELYAVPLEIFVRQLAAAKIGAEHLRRAIKWAEVNRPKWVAIMRRTKKHRIRKKYADRILRAYEEETA